MASNQLAEMIKCSQLTCEWENCGETFTDRLKFLSHITRTHVATFNYNQACKWEGCKEWEFEQMEHLQLHLSIHAYHHQIMFNGYKIMASTSKTLICFEELNHMFCFVIFRTQIELLHGFVFSQCDC